MHRGDLSSPLLSSPLLSSPLLSSIDSRRRSDGGVVVRLLVVGWQIDTQMLFWG
jgi:hypothetical protein